MAPHAYHGFPSTLSQGPHTILLHLLHVFFASSLSIMAFLLRKLLSDYDEDDDSLTCSSFCADDSSSKVCPSSCFHVCPKICYRQNVTTYLNPPPSSDQPFAKSHKFTLLLISLLSAVFIACLLAFLSVLYRRFYSRRFTSRVRSPPQPPDSYEEFIDEEEGPILDHPIWYIRTVGLQPSLISAITICKYKRSDGLIEGTDCSVCLTEFEEDESLRLLPKCNHAFHLPCIDTWLQSHTNCPLCRAPVFTVAPSPEPEPVTSRQAGVIQLEISQNLGDLSSREEGDEEEQEEEEEEVDDLPLVDDRRKRSGENCKGGGAGVQVVRRSVSLDSQSAFQISCAIPRVFQDPKSGSDQIELAGEKELNTVEISSKRSGKNENILSLPSASSSGKSTHRETVKRSLSCTSKFFLRSSSSQSKNGGIPI